MKLSVLNDVALQKKGGAEARVAATPDTVAGYVKAGHEVSVVKGAGAKADFADALIKRQARLLPQQMLRREIRGFGFVRYGRNGKTSRGHEKRRGHYGRSVADG